MTTFPKPCRDSLSTMAKEDPQELCDWIASGQLEAGHLTFAAEYLGQATDGQDVPYVHNCLLALLDHESCLVREGALYGIYHHRSKRAEAKVRAISLYDPSNGVRVAAGEVWGDWADEDWLEAPLTEEEKASFESVGIEEDFPWD